MAKMKNGRLTPSEGEWLTQHLTAHPLLSQFKGALILVIKALPDSQTPGEL